MADQINIQLTFEQGKLVINQDLMNAMWEPTRLAPHPVESGYNFDFKEERFGIVDLLCYLDEVKQDLRDQGPEAIITSVIELINSAYIGDENLLLVGRCMDIYGIEDKGRTGIVFRTVVLDARDKTMEDMLEIREAAQTLFPVPQPE
ncbi:MAG TPA: hypothetical protein VFV52_04050 [Bacilli bacterium]|nr:hypothetical protein [Bacilli bacterium]